MLEFFKSLNRTERLTLLACFLGWALDAMDANAATMLVPTLSKIFGVGTSEIGLMITATLIGTGIGGWLAGAASDRFGRVVTLQVTIAWFSIGSLVCGLAQTFPQLVVARVIQGIGFGGEWAVGAVLIAEIVKPQWRATALGIVQSGFSVGMAAAAAVYFAMFSLFPDDLAWRMVFIAGCLPALLIIFIRRAIVEPSTSATARAAGPVPGSLWRIFGPRYRRMTLLGSALCLALQGASAAIALWLPTLLTMHQKMSVGGMSAFFALQSVGAFIGYLAAARTADLIGRRRCLWLFMAAAAAIAALLCFARLGQTGSLVLALPLGIFAFGLYSNFGPVLSELFPHSVRGSGQGFCYNFGRGVGAVFPALVGLMAEGSGLAWAMGVVALSGYAAGGLIVLLLPETRGKILEDDAAEAAATDPAWTQHVHSH